MKKSVILMFSVIALSIVFFSCNNSVSDKKAEKETKKKEYKEVKNLEDFTQFTCHEELEEYFGKENLDSTVFWLSEGTEQFLVSIVNPDKMNKVVIYWNQKSGGWKDFESVEARYSSFDSDYEITDEKGTTYPIKCGLHAGSTLQDLESENGSPFSFYGMGWDYSGYVINLNEKLEDYLFIIGCPEMETAEELSEEYMNLLGDAEFSSDDEAAKLCDLRIVSINYLGK